jgi:hypothetical protein
MTILVVFLSGVLVGVVGHRLYTVKTVTGVSASRPPRPSPEEIRKHLISEMRERVKLDEQQVAKLNGIYDETRREFDELHKKANAETRSLWDNQTEKIKAILRPDQLPLYEQLRRQREEERRRRRAQGEPPPGPPPPGPDRN